MLTSRTTIILFVLVAVLAGVIWSAGTSYTLNRITRLPAEFLAHGFSKNSPYDNLESFGIAPLPDAYRSLANVAVPSSGKALRLDTEHKELVLFEDGMPEEVFTLAHVPEPSSPWYVSPGSYTIAAKRAEHESLLAREVWQHALFFGTNGVLHGEDRAENGYTLNSVDAGLLFQEAEEQMPLIVLSAHMPEAVRYEEVFSNLAARSGESSYEPTAKAYLLGDMQNGEVLKQKEGDTVLPIASVSKLMTALVAQSLARGPDELNKEERTELDELLYTMLLRSSNIAAEQVAELFGRERFISLMNKQAQKIGLEKTSFKDPSGLSAGNVSSAQDLFMFLQYLRENAPSILAITRQKTHTNGEEQQYGARVVRNHNYRVRTDNPYFAGGKDGYTPEAAQTTASLFSLPVTETKARTLAVVLLGSQNRTGDINRLLSAGAAETAYGISDFKARYQETYASLAGENTADARISVQLLGALHPDKNASLQALFSGLPMIKAADVSFLALEGVSSKQGYNVAGESAKRFAAGVEQELRAFGIDVVSVANTHAGDWGRGAFEAHISALRDAGIQVSGGGLNGRIAREPALEEKNGIRVGFISFSDTGPEWLAQEENLSVILSARSTEVAAIVENAAKKVDHLIVGFDFGEDKQERTRRTGLAHAAIDAGASVVVGLSGTDSNLYERYKDGTIFYGLGEFGEGEENNGILAELIFTEEGLEDIRAAELVYTEEGLRFK